MTRRRWLAGAAMAAVLGVGTWMGVAGAGLGAASPSPPAPPTGAPPAELPPAEPPRAVVAVTDIAPPVPKGETPMAQRVAVVGLLNKRNGQTRELTMKPGQAYRIGDTIVRLRACERTAPWEQDQLTGAFLQLDVRGADERWKRAFSGWIFKERPALNVVQHRVYDVWPKSCTMSFPAAGPETEVLAAGTAAGARASSAPKSPSTLAAPVASPATPAPSAALSNSL